MTQHHPWRRLRDLAHVTLRWHLGVPLGWADHSTQEVSIRLGLTQAQRRSTICHEVIHLERGPGYVGYEDREEVAVRRAAAKRLIGLHELGETLAWTHDLHEAAEELWVDTQTLRDRLTHLHPAERAYLRRRLADARGEEHD